MKIFQLSDLHIKDEYDIAYIKPLLSQFVNTVKQVTTKDEQIIICICGDIIEHNNKSGYLHSKEIIEYIISSLEDYNISFEFTPGNHDILNNKFTEFDNLSSQYIRDSRYEFENNSIVLRHYDNLDLVLINTAYHKDHEYGMIDFEALVEKITDSKNKMVFVMHHSLISEYPTDKSSIRNAHKLLDLISVNNVLGILHGHTHGYTDISIGKTCKLIGVGPFLKDIPNINNQFNIVFIDNGLLTKVENFRYHSDLNQFKSTVVYSSGIEKSFKGICFSDIYHEVKHRTMSTGYINNLCIRVETELEQFKHDIETNFSETIKIAKQWQEKTPPESLYYNHGQYMQSSGKWCMDYLKEELGNKSTSSRAIVPLINMHDVIDSGDGFLPSLDIIQFGFENEEKSKLYVTIYLRALEVNHFLKINICELYLMINELVESFRAVHTLEITIFAFRVQHKEKFGCFQKSKIDQISLPKLTIMLYTRDYDSLIKLLVNKMDLSETVINIDGVNNLCNAYNEIIKEDNYEDLRELKSTFDKIQDSINYLKGIREKTSNYIEIESKEKKYLENMNELITKLNIYRNGR